MDSRHNKASEEQIASEGGMREPVKEEYLGFNKTTDLRHPGEQHLGYVGDARALCGIVRVRLPP